VQACFLYFSGTGNTHYVAHYLAHKVQHLPVEIVLQPVEQQPAATLVGFDLLVLGFPVYACDSPTLLHPYIEQLTPGAGRGALVFCTKGAWAGNAVSRNLERLARRGYVPLGGTSVGMPGSDGLAFIGKDSWMARAALRKDYDHLVTADRLAERMEQVLTGLLAGTPVEHFRCPRSRRIGVLLVDWLWAAVYRWAEGYLRRRFWSDERCIGCGLCARICPVDNIKVVQGHARFQDHCALCMRCIHACPQEAIQIGQATVDKFRWHGPRGDFNALRLRPGKEIPTQTSNHEDAKFSNHKGTKTPRFLNSLCLRIFVVP
jgi:ferredoxin